MFMTTRAMARPCNLRRLREGSACLGGEARGQCAGAARCVGRRGPAWPKSRLMQISAAQPEPSAAAALRRAVAPECRVAQRWVRGGDARPRCAASRRA
jgi:hypothetical protein